MSLDDISIEKLAQIKAKIEVIKKGWKKNNFQINLIAAIVQSADAKEVICSECKSICWFNFEDVEEMYDEKLPISKENIVVCLRCAISVQKIVYELSFDEYEILSKGYFNQIHKLGKPKARGAA